MQSRRRLQETPERANPVILVHCWESPAGANVRMLIVTHLCVYSTIHEHATQALPNETGGFLLGRVGFDEGRATWLVEIDECMPVEPAEQDPVSFSFTWRDVDRVRSHRAETEKALVGWYHTHPGMGIFLSDTDLEKSHRRLFAEPFQIALVYDPTRGRAGYFFWEGVQQIDASEAAWREFQISPDSAEPLFPPDSDTTSMPPGDDPEPQAGRAPERGREVDDRSSRW
jgi:proteasome lid subunit RPN8/RPN11